MPLHEICIMRKMTETLIHLPDLSDKEGVIDRIVEGLGRVPIDYVERYEFIRRRNEAGDRWLAAGVILLLHYQEGTGRESGFVLQLIKRSSEVPQPGDLSCPGGMLHPVGGPFLARPDGLRDSRRSCRGKPSRLRRREAGTPMNPCLFF